MSHVCVCVAGPPLPPAKAGEKAGRVGGCRPQPVLRVLSEKNRTWEWGGQ